MSAPRSSLVWKLICAASLVANAALLIVIFPPERSKPAAPAASVATPNRNVSRELQPYAALGSYLAEHNHIPELRWTAPQFDAFQTGMRATYEGGGYPVDEDAERLRQDINRKVQGLMQSQQADPLQDYLRHLREKENVLQTASGLHYRVTEAGRGATPGVNATVVVSFTAQTPGGEKIAGLTRVRATVRLADLLPGLREGIRLLSVGGKALLYLPPSLSFAGKEWPAGIQPGTPLVFFVELHDVKP